MPINLSRIPKNTRQLVLVQTNGWNSTTGVLALLERDKKHADRWTLHQEWPVVIGKSGCRWGLGLHKNPASKRLKKEGDGASPAGLFSIGTAYTKETGLMKALRKKRGWPCRRLTKDLYGVDDAASPYYNRIVRRHSGMTNRKKHMEPFTSAEHLFRRDSQYDILIDLGHNQPRPVAGAGSCIYLHVWKNSRTPTAGCTAMKKSNLKVLLLWLRPSKNPLFIQAPRSAVSKPWATASTASSAKRRVRPS